MLSVSPRRRNGHDRKCCCHGKEHRPMVSSTENVSGGGGAMPGDRDRRPRRGPKLASRAGVHWRPSPARALLIACSPSRTPCSEGAGATAFLDQWPLRLPPPPSLIRAYSLPGCASTVDPPQGARRRAGGHGRRVPPLRRSRQAALAVGPAGDGPRLGSGLGHGRQGRSVGSIALGEWAGALGSAGIAAAGPGPMIISGEDCCCWPTRISRTRGTP